MFKQSDQICDGADVADSVAADDSANFMCESSDSETGCGW